MNEVTSGMIKKKQTNLTLRQKRKCGAFSSVQFKTNFRRVSPPGGVRRQTIHHWWTLANGHKEHMSLCNELVITSSYKVLTPAYVDMMINCATIHCEHCARCNCNAGAVGGKEAEEQIGYFWTVYSKHRSHILVSLYQLRAHFDPIQIQTQELSLYKTI